MRPTLDELVLADDAGAWRALGFRVDDAVCPVGSTRVVFAGRGAGEGIVEWALRDVDGDALDGLRTRVSCAPPPPPAEHPNGARSVDHVVVVTPDFERTTGALEAAGVGLRREIEMRGARMGFFRLGEVILELVEDAEGARDAPARFWGLVVVVVDLDASAELLGDRLGSIRDAVQRGRRIATVREQAGIAVPLAFMSPAP